MTLGRPVSVVMPVPLWLVAGRARIAGRGHTLAPCENVFIARCNKRRVAGAGGVDSAVRSEEHTSELQSLMRISYAVFCLKKKTIQKQLQRLETEQRQRYKRS